MSQWHLVTEDFPPGFTGGIASWAQDLAQALCEGGAAVRVVARHTGGTQSYDDAQPWTTHRARGRHWSRWRGRWAQLSLSRHIKANDRVIFSHWGLAQNSVGMMRRRDARYALTFHGSDLTQLSEAPAALHAVVAQADALLPVSQFLADELTRLGLINTSDPRVRVLPMPIPDLPARTEQGRGLVCVARPTSLKGIPRVIALARALDMPLTLVGPTDPGLGILSREDAHAAMARAAACVLLPRTTDLGRGAEGLGMVLLEAAAQGVPVIGCDTGGVSEAVGPGLLIDPDNPDLSAIRTFLQRPEAGAQARAWVRQAHGAAATLRTLQAAMP
jgi:glycosyltransferase involved in cell wall biosynthesis